MQLLKCPFPIVKVTQYDNGNFSHQGSDAWDITDGVAGSKAPYFAPCDVICKAIDTRYAFTWWQSVNPVKFADGTEDYATIMFGHDNTINCFVGQKIGQGVQLGNMGTGGNATGVHCHIEVAKGKFYGKWYRNPQGVFCLYDTIKFYDAFFMDDVKLIDIKEDVKAKFKYARECHKFVLSNDYDYKLVVLGKQYQGNYTSYIESSELLAQGYEEMFACTGGIFYNYENQMFAEGLEKSQGTNNQDVSMSAVTDLKDCYAIADNFEINKTSYFIDNLGNYENILTSCFGVMKNGEELADNSHQSQYNSLSGRVLVGTDADNNPMVFAEQGVTGKSGYRGKDLYNLAKKLGFNNAVCMDGGGSVWLRINGQFIIDTNRKVKNGIALYRKKKCNCEEYKSQIATLTEQLVSANKKIEKLEIENLKFESQLKDANDKLAQIKNIIK